MQNEINSLIIIGIFAFPFTVSPGKKPLSTVFLRGISHLFDISTALMHG
ncbi:hypothetical protein EPYR_01412 [Erwinia pyrifoliae DSM 12163]|nr:hypothetical protein EPYR_01412 [Erwinia pyrifoliae DSM 12163]